MRLDYFSHKWLKPETKILLIFTAIIWMVSIVTRYVLFEGWDGIGVILTGMVATFILWGISLKLNQLPLMAVLLLSPFIAILIEIFHWELISLSFNRKFSWQLDHFELRRYATGVYMWSLFYLTLLLGYFAIFNYFRFMHEALAGSAARVSAHEAQLKMLRYQINPHFLFNALNSVSALVLDNKNERADSMIESLSKFLRFSLDETPNAKIPLKEEISIIQEYLEIEKIRFSDKLETEFDIHPDTVDHLVPSLILQPAIENAIKHAIAKMTENGKIIITSRIVEKNLKLCVADNGPGLEETTKVEGIGLQNMRERLRASYTQPARLSVESEEGQGVNICILIPIEKGAK